MEGREETLESILIYYPFTLAKVADSGSKLRPLQMKKALEKWGEKEGISVITISGNSKERQNQFQKLLTEKKLENIRFCYVENQTIPLWLTDPKHIPQNPWIDRVIFQYLQKKNVPIGIFYRDVYWKFDELYPLSGWKKKIMQWIYRREERFYEKYGKALFLPSMEMGAHVDIEILKAALPPGGQALANYEKKPHEGTKGLYVGGIAHQDYGLSLLLDSLEIVQGKGVDYRLTICCREQELQSIPDEARDRMKQLSVEVVHLSGESLQKLYQEMDFALIPRYRSTYNDFAVPVKLVEYLSNLLPVVATDCSAQKSFVESGPYGIVSQDEANSMADAIINMAQTNEQYRKQIQEDFLDKHSWLTRAYTIAHVLGGEKHQ